MKCRYCGHELVHVFVDLDHAPPSNAYLTADQLKKPESYFPLKVFVCDQCWLVQAAAYQTSMELFSNEYAYFSSFSSSWVAHAKKYAYMIADRLRLDTASLVVEVASNDGYLLQFFQQMKIPCLGIEPTQSTADAAISKGIDTVQSFFTEQFADAFVMGKMAKADLIIGNNVLAHVPDPNDFTKGLKLLLADGGTVTLEFPHLLNLIHDCQFDTIYHEHFSYFSFQTAQKILASNGLTVYDVEELPTHGGSLRIYACHSGNDSLPVTSSVSSLLEKEQLAGLFDLKTYAQFQNRVEKAAYNFLNFLLQVNAKGKQVAGYGAAAKGNTLLNYCGVKKSLIRFVADASPYKQGKFLPGSHIPILAPQHLRYAKPDYIIFFPWNLKNELKTALSYTRDWGCHFVAAIPELEIF